MICAGLTGSTGSVRDKTEILHLNFFWDPWIEIKVNVKASKLGRLWQKLKIYVNHLFSKNEDT